MEITTDGRKVSARVGGSVMRTEPLALFAGDAGRDVGYAGVSRLILTFRTSRQARDFSRSCDGAERLNADGLPNGVRVPLGNLQAWSFARNGNSPGGLVQIANQRTLVNDKAPYKHIMRTREGA